MKLKKISPILWRLEYKNKKFIGDWEQSLNYMKEFEL